MTDRRHLTFDCGSDILSGSVDNPLGEEGLVIVSGGTEPRTGAFGWQSSLARRLAERGYSVFRFDRRGVGDSEGEDPGYANAQDDIASAIQAFRKHSAVRTIVGFGNCDAATALALSDLELDGLVLANPWIFEETNDASPTAATVRQRYGSRLRQPSQWLRLVRGEVDLRKLAGGMRRALGKDAEPSLSADMRSSLNDRNGLLRFLIAERDRTGTAFAQHWKGDARLSFCPGADHAFSGDEHQAWLEERLVEALEQAG